jgi:hypothetical protein
VQSEAESALSLAFHVDDKLSLFQAIAPSNRLGAAKSSLALLGFDVGGVLTTIGIV